MPPAIAAGSEYSALARPFTTLLTTGVPTTAEPLRIVNVAVPVLTRPVAEITVALNAIDCDVMLNVAVALDANVPVASSVRKGWYRTVGRLEFVLWSVI